MATLLTWKVPEYVRHQRGRLWYVLAGVFGGVFILYGILTNNFLFALIIVIFAIILVLLHMQEPATVDFALTNEGISLGGRTVDYINITNFWIVLKPDEGLKSIHFRTKHFTNPLISAPIGENVNVDDLREMLKQYVSEDLEEKDEPILEMLSRNFKF